MRYVALALVGFVLGCAHSRNAIEAGVCFEVYFTNAKERFVIKLESAQQIAEARRLIGMDPETAPHVSGIIVKGREDYNPRWHFHLEPSSIEFKTQNMELCDAKIQDVEENLDKPYPNFPPGARWCPWKSRVLRELPAPVRHSRSQAP